MTESEQLLARVADKARNKVVDSVVDLHHKEDLVDQLGDVVLDQAEIAVVK